MSISGEVRVAAVSLTAAGLLAAGLGVATPGGSDVLPGPTLAVSAAARTKAMASLNATYSVSAAGVVTVNAVSNAKYVKFGWRSGSGKARRKTVRVRAGRATLALSAGSTRAAVKALATSRLLATGWVPVAAAQPATQTGQTTPVAANPPSSGNPSQAVAAAGMPPNLPGDYSFLGTQPSDATAPIAWSRCEPIRVRIDPGDPGLGLGTAEVERLQVAITSLAGASGLPLSFAGQTRDQSADPADTEIIVRFVAGPLDGGAAGFGGYSSRTSLRAPDRALWQFIDYGHVELSVGEIARANPQQRQELYMHELGHAIGLGHASSTSQIMYEVDDNEGIDPAWGSGDLAGLAVLAASPCRAAS